MAKETPGASRFEPLSALWRVLAAPQTLLILMGLVALSLTLGVFVPQIPQQAANEPQAWLAVQSSVWGQGNGLVRAVGLFDLYHSFWFRLLLVLLGLCLFVQAAESADLAWRLTRQRPWTLTALAFWGNHPPQIQLSSSLPSDELEARATRFLAERGYWLTDVPAQSLPNLVASRRGWAFWARSLGYGALLLALAGLAMVASWGWQGEQWRPIPGETHALGHDTPYTVRLDAFRMQLGDGQQLQSYRSEITWLEGENELEQSMVGVGQPVTRGGVTVRQVGYVPVVRMRGWDADNQPLTLETAESVLGVPGEAEIRFSSAQAQPIVLISDQDLFLALTFEPMCAEGRPALYVDRIQGSGAERQPLGVLTESGSLTVDGLRLDLELFFVPVLQADQRSATGLVVASMALVVAALMAMWLLRPHLVWIAVREGDEQRSVAHILALPGTGSYRWLPQLADRLREALSDDA